MNLADFIKDTYKKLKKYINYIIFGVLTTLISIVSFYAFLKLNVEYKFANIISFILAVSFAYVSNKFYVFEKKSETFKELIQEMFNFLLARIGSFVFDFFSLILCVDLFNFDKMISKTIITIIVIILNYLISEFFVFRRKKYNKSEK